MQNAKEVAIDNDFLNHLLEINSHKYKGDTTELIRRFFAALNVAPIMHPMVYTHEAKVVPNAMRDVLFNDGTLSVKELQTILDARKGGANYYTMMVKNIYKDFKGVNYPCSDMFQHW